MNILQVTPGYWPEIGGVERHVEALTERLVARGHNVTVATLVPRGQKTGNGTRGGAEVRRFPAWGIGDAYRLPRGLAGFIRANRNRWDVIHVHNYHAPLIPLVAFGGGEPFVATTHLNDAPHSAAAGLLHRPYRLVGGAAVRRAAAIVCVTEAERERVIGRLGAEPARTTVIPNGFDPALLKARENSGARDPFLLLSVGRLQAYKRVAEALRSLALLDERYRLAVVGDGPQRSELTALAAELGLTNRVTFAGRASDGDLTDWYGRAGTVISLSAAEAFGMTVLEGVAAGAQVVASDIPAFRDLARLFPGQVIIVDAEAPEQVAQGARQAVTRAGNALEDVSAFTWDAVTERLIEVYRGAMERADVLNRVRKQEDGPKISDARTGAE